MISLLFAVEHEAGGVRRALTGVETFQIADLPCWVGKYANQELSVGFVGMGGTSAGRRTRLFLRYFQPRLVILAGYAGALVADLPKGEVLIAQNYSKTYAGRVPSQLRSVSLVSAEEIIGGRVGRESLLQSSGAKMVDMETAAVQAEVGRLGLPFLALRAISDGVGDNLPQGALAAAYDQKLQRTTAWRLLAYLASHPQEIGPFAEFVSGLTPVRQKLTEALLETIRLQTEEA